MKSFVNIDPHFLVEGDGSGEDLPEIEHEGLGEKQANGLNVAFKFDGGKPRMDLIDPVFLEELANVLTFGSDKYDESKKVYLNNWRQGGMRWGQVFASMMRHAWAWWRGEDRDPETGMSHLAHLSANAMFLSNYSRRALHLDDRDHAWRRKIRVGLDLDGVIVNWCLAIEAACKKHDPNWESKLVDGEPNWWYWLDMPFLKEVIESMDYAEFLATAPERLVEPSELDFEPVAYITHRHIPSEFSARWVADNGFPYAPVVSVDEAGDKAKIIREMNLDVFVEDKFETFVQLQNEGILCFLMDRPYNRMHDVGNYRITHLNQIKERMA